MGSPRAAPALWLGLAVALPLAVTLGTALNPFDLWWSLDSARHVLAHRSLDAPESLSFAQSPVLFHRQSWLAQLALFGVHRAGGLAALQSLLALTTAGSYALLARALTRASGSLRAACLASLAVAGALGMSNWTVRAQLLVLPVLVLFLAELFEAPLRRARLTLPLLLALWSNLHGSFALGVTLVLLRALTALARRATGRDALVGPESAAQWASAPRDVALLLLASLAATCCNPYGPLAWRYVTRLSGGAAVRALNLEWHPPTLSGAGSQPLFFLALAGLAALSLRALRAGKVPPLEALAVGLLALTARRHALWFGLLAAWPFALALASWLERRAPLEPPAPSRAAVVGLAGLLLAVCALAPVARRNALLGEDTPAALARPLLDAAPRRVFATDVYADYLHFVAPQHRVFLDGRSELWSPRVVRDYLRLSRGQSVGALLEEYDADAVLLTLPEQEPLERALASLGAPWRRAAQGPRGSLWLRGALVGGRQRW